MSPTCHLLHGGAANPRAGQVVFFPSKPRSGCLHLDCKGPNHSGLVPVRRHRSDARCVLFIQVELLFLFMALCQGIGLESSRLTNSMTSNGSKAHYLSTRPYWNGLPMQHLFCSILLLHETMPEASSPSLGNRVTKPLWFPKSAYNHVRCLPKASRDSSIGKAFSGVDRLEPSQGDSERRVCA